MSRLFQTYELQGEHPGPSLLITAGVHGDEWEPMLAVRALFDKLQPDSMRGRLMMIPIVNQPAYAAGARAASDGLDLARICPGRADGSVTERIAHELSTLIRQCDYYLDLHTGGVNLEIWPMVGYLLHEDAEILKQQRELARGANLPVVWGSDANLQGRTLSVARDAGVPAIYVEYLGSGVFLSAAVTELIRVCENVMRTVGMLDGAAPPNRTRWFCEDPTPGSGHLQVGQHPAPEAGLFVAAVAAGERIKQGATLGNLEGDDGHSYIIQAEISGHVMAMRVFPRVSLGDSLAAIVALEE